MSLKAFHLVFISVCVVLMAFVAAWASQQFMTGRAATYAVTAAGALAIGAGLAFYGAAFQRKTRRL
jgi:phosphate/sulfate permease